MTWFKLYARMAIYQRCFEPDLPSKFTPTRVTRSQHPIDGVCRNWLACRDAETNKIARCLGTPSALQVVLAEQYWIGLKDNNESCSVVLSHRVPWFAPSLQFTADPSIRTRTRTDRAWREHIIAATASPWGESQISNLSGAFRLWQ